MPPNQIHVYLGTKDDVLGYKNGRPTAFCCIIFLSEYFHNSIPPKGTCSLELKKIFSKLYKQLAFYFNFHF